MKSSIIINYLKIFSFCFIPIKGVKNLIFTYKIFSSIISFHYLSYLLLFVRAPVLRTIILINQLSD